MNNVSLIGRLTKDPDVRYNQEMAIARYTLAVDRYSKNEKQADFINCVSFGKRGEFAEKFLRKGMKVGLTGSIKTRSYDNKEGQKVYTTDVIVDNHYFCESKNADSPAPVRAEVPTDDDGFVNPDAITEELPFE